MISTQHFYKHDLLISRLHLLLNSAIMAVDDDMVVNLDTTGH